MVAASYVLTPHAQEDVDLEVDNIEEEGAALRWIDDIHDALQRLGQTPGLGHARSDITSHDVLFWTFRKRWAVIYLMGSPITVIRVVPWLRVTPGFWIGAGW